ncbi:kinesin light chain 1 [Trichoderma arundinaceum]|uniref:Kinesin light chain 1 n=1 Tax=Trichoderma arundinaceum TaxID=490622 RepID=A0A395NWP3_TRIAR|nr:kinesin light chain 1 [Trichoderma arundinaceum]
MYEPGLHTIYDAPETTSGVHISEPELDPAKSAIAMRLDDHAKMLLRCLEEKRKNAPQRPIVFLCHSLGGIVVKSALVEGTLDPAYRSIVKSTRLLVFFATPHLGGNYSGIGDIAAKIVRTGLGAPSNDLLDGLKSGSRDVIRRFEQARHLPDNCLVISFYETENYGRFGLIVEKESAVMNLSEEREKQVALKANHSKVCKFPTADSCEPVMELIVSQLERALELERASEPGPANVHWMVNKSPNALFTGRDELVQRIVDAMEPGLCDSEILQKRFIITGIGGQGKSEVCVNVAHKLRNKFWGVFWVDVATEATTARGFTRIARALGSDAKEVDDICMLLANWPADQNWLLILDNADDNAVDYQDYIPSGARGAVLMTSRLPECAVHNTVGHVELENLSKEHCVELLLNVMKVSEPLRAESVTPAVAIAEEMGFHTLAMLQAGAYILTKERTMEEYLIDYRKQKDELLRFIPSQARSRYRNVWTTFEISAQALQSSETQPAQDALQLLEVLSTLHHEDIPVDFFQDTWRGAKVAQTVPEEEERLDRLSQWHVSQLPEFMDVQESKWNDVRFSFALRELSSLALIKVTRNESERMISLHPLIHSWVAVRQDDTHRRSRIQSSACIIALAQYSRNKWQPHLERLGHHITSLIASPSLAIDKHCSRKMLQVFLQIGIFLQSLRYDTELSTLLGQMLHYFNTTPETPDKDTLPLFYVLSQNQYHLGEVEQCIRTIKRVRKVQRSELEENDTDRLATDQELARAYNITGQWKEAIVILENIRQIHESHFNLRKNDPDRLSVLGQLSEAYESSGRTKDAISLLTEVVSIEQPEREKGDPGLFASKYKLATFYMSNCQIDEAVAIFKELNEVQTTNYSDRHPFRLGPQIGLAQACIENGKPSEAIDILENMRNTQSRLLDVGHPLRAAIEHHLGAAYRHNGQSEKAVSALWTALKLSKYRENHPHQIAIQYELAAAYRADGQIAAAIRLLEKLEGLKDSPLDNEHPLQNKIRAELATVYLLDGKWEKAIYILHNAIDVQRKSDKDHPNLVALEQKLGTAYLNNGEVKKSIEIMEGVLQKPPHPRELPINRFVAQHQLGTAYLADGQINAAIGIFKRVVKDKESFFHRKHPERLASLHELARAYLINGQIKEAIQLCEEVVLIQTSSLSAEHPDQLKSRRLLGSAYLDDGQISKAVEILTQVDKSEQRRVGDTHPDRLQSQYQLGLAYIKAGQLDEAVALFENATKAAEDAFPEDHPTRIAVRHQLANVYLQTNQIESGILILEEIARPHESSDIRKGQPGRVAALHLLGSTYTKNGRAAEAVGIFEKVVEIRSSLGESHPNRLASQHELGCCYLSLGRLDDAINVFKEVIRIEASAFHINDVSRAISKAMLGSTYLMNGLAKEAVEVLKSVYIIRRKHLEQHNVSRLTSEHELGRAYLEIGDSKKGIAMLEEVLTTERQCLEQNHPLRLRTQYELAIAYMSIIKVEQAIQLLENLVAIKQRYPGDGYPMLNQVQNDLARAYKERYCE